MAGVPVNQLPVANPDQPVSVVGTQNGATVQQEVPPAVHYPEASETQAVEGTSSTTLMTPDRVRTATESQRNQLSVMWGDWTYSTLTGTAKAAFTGIPLVTDLSSLTIPTGDIGVFYDTATGAPTIAGDTLRHGLVFNTTFDAVVAGQFTRQARVFLVTYFDTAGIVFWNRFTSGAVSRLDLGVSNVAQVYDVEGTGMSDQWRAVSPIGINGPSVTGVEGWVVDRAPLDLTAYALSYSGSTYTVNKAVKKFIVPVDGATARDALMSLTGTNRLNISAVQGAQQGQGGSGSPIYVADAAADLPASPAADDLLLVLSAFTSGGVSYADDTLYRYVSNAWEAVNVPASSLTGIIAAANLPVLPRSKIPALDTADVATGRFPRDRLPETLTADALVSTYRIPKGNLAGGGGANQVLALDSTGTDLTFSTLAFAAGGNVNFAASGTDMATLATGSTNRVIIVTSSFTYSNVRYEAGSIVAYHNSTLTLVGGTPMKWNLITTLQPTYFRISTLSGSDDSQALTLAQARALTLADSVVQTDLPSGNHLTDYSQVYFSWEVDDVRTSVVDPRRPAGAGLAKISSGGAGEPPSASAGADGNAFLFNPPQLLGRASTVARATFAEGAIADNYSPTPNHIDTDNQTFNGFHRTTTGSGITSYTAVHAEGYTQPDRPPRLVPVGAQTSDILGTIVGGQRLYAKYSTWRTGNDIEDGIVWLPILIESASRLFAPRYWTSSTSNTHGANTPYRLKVWGLR